MHLCAQCNGKLSYVKEYSQWYCYNCEEYREVRKQPPKMNVCRTCGGTLDFVQEYKQWYCYTCEEYQGSSSGPGPSGGGRGSDEKIVYVAKDESRGPPSMATVGVGGGLMSARVGEDKKRYDVYFTDQRIVAAVIFSQSDMSKWGPAAGLQMGAAAFKWKKMKNEKRAQFKGRSPSQILHMHHQSFDVPYNEIRSVQVKKKLIGAMLIVHAHSRPKIEIPIAKTKMERITSVLNKYIPGKVN
jgi:predicted RNA-binding Zn-ribbon protein involved in translation (DUF1610 family)